MSAPIEPPAVLWVRPEDQPDFDDVPFPGAHRYVLAPEGSAVIPPELVEALLEHFGTTLEAQRWRSLAAILRAARGGAS